MADARVAGEVRVGISGWRYPPWRGVFYPRGPRRSGASWSTRPGG